MPSYGMNWKMTAKTILLQIHHKAETLELLGKKLVLALQDVFYDYITREFSTDVLKLPSPENSVHWHIYGLAQNPQGQFSMQMKLRQSTTAAGIASLLGMRQNPILSEDALLTSILAKIGAHTLLRMR